MKKEVTYKVMMISNGEATVVATGFCKRTAQLYIKMCKSQDEAERQMGYDVPEARYAYSRA